MQERGRPRSSKASAASLESGVSEEGYSEDDAENVSGSSETEDAESDAEVRCEPPCARFTNLHENPRSNWRQTSAAWLT